MTTTAEQTTEEVHIDGPDVSGADPTEGKTLATIRPEQQRWDEHQVAILRQLGIEDATQGDLDLFFHVCRTTGLDPFRKQIYMIGRNTKVSEWVDTPSGGRRKEERWVTKYTIQTGIDGYRRNVRESAKALGDEIRVEGPWFTGADDFHITDDGEVIQHWRKVWPLKSAPHAARFVTYRNGEPFEGITHFDDYVQTTSQGEPNSMWAKMPRNQIAKCAEALSYKRAYPDDLSGLILEDSAQPTVIDQDGNVESGPRRPEPKRSEPITVDDIMGTPSEPVVIEGEVAEPETTDVTQQETPVGAGDTEQADTEVEDTTAGPDQGAPITERARELRASARKKLNDHIFAIFGELKLTGDDRRDDRLDVIRGFVGAPDLASSKELTDDQLQTLRNELADRKKAGTLDADVTELINAAELRREGIDQ